MNNKTLSLSELFAEVEIIHGQIANHQNFDLNFLTLTATNAFHQGRWTASFASLAGLSDEWFEETDLPLTARGDTPEEAIAKAIALVTAVLN